MAHRDPRRGAPGEPRPPARWPSTCPAGRATCPDSTLSSGCEPRTATPRPAHRLLDRVRRPPSLAALSLATPPPATPPLATLTGDRIEADGAATRRRRGLPVPHRRHRSGRRPGRGARPDRQLVPPGTRSACGADPGAAATAVRSSSSLGGSGIVPLMAMIRAANGTVRGSAAVFRPHPGRRHLRPSEEQGGAPAAPLARRHLPVHPRGQRPEHAHPRPALGARLGSPRQRSVGWTGDAGGVVRRGRISVDDVTWGPGTRRRKPAIFVCGPSGFVEAALQPRWWR